MYLKNPAITHKYCKTIKNEEHTFLFNFLLLKQDKNNKFTSTTMYFGIKSNILKQNIVF